MMFVVSVNTTDAIVTESEEREREKKGGNGRRRTKEKRRTRIGTESQGDIVRGNIRAHIAVEVGCRWKTTALYIHIDVQRSII